jgi:diaminopimelate epimerase
MPPLPQPAKPGKISERVLHRFFKYQATGNDFLLAENSAEEVSPELVRRLCDRHFGVGADGVLLIARAPDDSRRARMIVLNADGSRPEMCGNGLRCAALHLARSDGATQVSYLVDTDAGLRGCEVERQGDRAQVRVNMGTASWLGEQQVQFDGRPWKFLRMSIGNPHAIVFSEIPEPATIDRLAAEVSASIEGGSNVEFANLVSPSELKLVVWERGVGRTLACGSGAAATVAAAVRTGKLARGQTAKVHLPGGTLELSTSDNGEQIALRGPASLVFLAEVPDL